MNFQSSRPARFAPILALLAIVSGCGDSPTGPKPPGASILYPGRVVSGTVNSLRDTMRYDLALTQGQDAIVYFMAKGERLRLEVRDSSGQLVSATSDARNTGYPERRSTEIIRAASSFYRVAVSSVDADVSSDYEIRVVAASRAPEHASVVVPLNTVVTGEDIGHAQDVDSFTVTSPQDQEVNVYFRQTRHTSQSIAVYVSHPIYGLAGTLLVTGADTILGAQASGRITLSAGITYTILVYGYSGDTTSVPYELEVRTIDRRPETGPAAITPTDTLRAAIDYPGDVDEYTLTGTPGARFNLFAEAQGSAPHGVRAAIGPPVYGQPSAQAIAGGTPLAGNASGIFVLPASGQLTITVTDVSERSIASTGAYTLLVIPIDSGTEATAAALPLDVPVTSRIDYLGDLDVFTLTTDADTAVNFTLRRSPGVAGRPLRLTLLTAGDSVVSQRLMGVDNAGEADTVALGTRWLRPGSYKLRVEPTGAVSGAFVGDYEILARTVRTSPEHRAGTIAIGDTIRDETLDFAGDIDRFHVFLSASDSISIVLDGLAQAVGAKAYLYRAGDGQFVGGVETNNRLPGRSRIIRNLPAGDYYVEVSGQTAGIAQLERGSYELSVNRITSGPESGSATITLGDTVYDRLDAPGDVDQFTLTAPAGTLIAGGFVYEADNTICCATIEIVDPATGAVIEQPPIGSHQIGRATVPAGGSVVVRVHEPYYCDQFGNCNGPYFTASYHFWLAEVNIAPETRPAAFTIGDTVSGESIDPFADIDEFTFDGTAGDTVNVYFQTPHGAYGYYGLTLALIGPESSTPLGALNSNATTSNLEDIALTRIVLPVSGRYVVRVAGATEYDNKGEYRFRIARAGQ